MKGSFVLGFLVCLLSFGPLAADRLYTSAEGDFSIQLPGKPLRLPSGKGITQYLHLGHKFKYVITVSDVAGLHRFSGEELEKIQRGLKAHPKVIEEMAKAWIRKDANRSDHLREFGSLEIKDRKGFFCKAKDDGDYYLSLYVIQGNKVYQVRMSRKGQWPKWKYFERFVESLNIND